MNLMKRWVSFVQIIAFKFLIESFKFSQKMERPERRFSYFKDGTELGHLSSFCFNFKGRTEKHAAEFMNNEVNNIY